MTDMHDPINDFAPADHPTHPSNHPGPGVPVSTRSVPWDVTHLLDPVADAGGVSEQEVADRRVEYDDLIFAHGSNTEFDAFADRAPGHPVPDDPGYPSLFELRARRDAALAADKKGDPTEDTDQSEKDGDSGQSEEDANPTETPDATTDPDDDPDEAALRAALAALDGK